MFSFTDAAWQSLGIICTQIAIVAGILVALINRNTRQLQETKVLAEESKIESSEVKAQLVGNGGSSHHDVVLQKLDRLDQDIQAFVGNSSAFTHDMVVDTLGQHDKRIRRLEGHVRKV